MMLESADRKKPTLTSLEIIFDELQHVITNHQRHRQRQADDVRSQDRALH